MKNRKTMNILEFIDAMHQMNHDDDYIMVLVDSCMIDGKFDKIEAYQCFLSYYLDYKGE